MASKENIPTIEIVVSDFGFSGFVGIKGKENLRPQIGWSSSITEWKCGSACTAIEPLKMVGIISIPKIIRILHNVLQLETVISLNIVCEKFEEVNKEIYFHLETIDSNLILF